MLVRELKPGLCDDLEWRRDGEGGGRQVHGGGDIYIYIYIYIYIHTYGWFMLMCGRDQHNTVKQLSLN